MKLSNFNNYLILGLILFCLSCSSSEEPSSDLPTIIFGHFFSECFGERCLETYMLQGESLFEDTNDSFFRDDFDFVSLPDSLYLQVNDLRDLIPDELSDIEGQTFGCPDCGDQGGIFLQLVDDDRVFSIDLSTRDLPDFLAVFVDQVNDRIALLP